MWAEALSLEGRYAEADAVAEEGNAWLRGRSIAGPLEAWLWLSQSRNASRQGRYDEAGAILDRIRRSGGLGGSADVETVGFFEAAAILNLALRTGDISQSRRLFDELPPGVPGHVATAVVVAVAYPAGGRGGGV